MSNKGKEHVRKLFEMGLMKGKISELIGVHHVTMSYYLSNKRNMSDLTAFKAKCLSTEFQKFIEKFKSKKWEVENVPDV